MPRAVELGICKDSRRGLGILSTLTRRAEEEHHTDFACLLQLLPRMRLTENSSEGSAVDPSQAPTVENFGSDNPFAYACIRALFVV